MTSKIRLGANMKTIQQLGKKYISGLIMLLLLIVITYYYIFRNCNMETLVSTITDSDYKYLLLGIVMVLVYMWLEGINLHIIGKSLGVKFGWIRSFCYSCIDLYYCGITPSASGGQPILAYYMARDGVPLSKATIIILMYTVVYKLVLILMGIGVMLLHRDFILQNEITLILYLLGMVLNIVIISVCVLCMYSRYVVRKIVVKVLTFLAKIHLLKSYQKKLEMFDQYVEEYHRSAQFVKENRMVLAKSALNALVQRLSLFSVGYLVYRSFGLSNFHFFDILALQVVIAITVDTLPLPGGVGASEAMFFLLYMKVYAVDYIAPAMVLTRGISFYFILILSGIISVVYHMLTAKTSEARKGRVLE